MDAGQFQDWDGDGYPDHVLGPDGLWHAFNPQTGETISSPLSANLSGGNPYLSSSLGSFEVGAQGRPELPSDLPPPPGGFGAGTAPRPSYANGVQNPLWSGQPLTPGGTYRGPNGGSSGYQKQVSVPGGAAAGPFETRGAYPPSQHSYGGDSTSGGGGANAGANSPIGQKLESKVRGMASKIQGFGSPNSSGYSSSGYSSNYKAPNPYEPGTPRMRGLASKLDPTAAAGLYSNPQMMMERVAPNLNGASNRYSEISSLPASELALLTGGNKLSAPKRDLYGNLTDKDRSLSDYSNSLASLYNNIINRENWVDYDQMVGNLMNAGRHSALGSQFMGLTPAKQAGAPDITKDTRRNSRGVPAGTQISSFLNASSAIFGSTLPSDVAASRQEYATQLANEFGARYLTKKPTRTPNIARRIGDEVFYQ